jgi:hypothetical protein
MLDIKCRFFPRTWLCGAYPVSKALGRGYREPGYVLSREEEAGRANGW